MERTIKMIAGNKAIQYDGSFYIPKYQTININSIGNRIMSETNVSVFDIGDKVNINEASSGIGVKKGDTTETWVYYKHI